MAPAESFDSAISDDTSFGEFAVDLTAAGLWPEPGDCTTYSSPFVMTQTGNAEQAQLEDYVGLAPLPVSACGDVVIIKETDPAESEPPVGFGYQFERESGAPVTGGDTTESGTLTVPGDPTVEIDDVVAATDYVLSEPTQPDGWQLDGIVCQARSRTGARQPRRDGRTDLPRGPRCHGPLHDQRRRTTDAHGGQTGGPGRRHRLRAERGPLDERADRAVLPRGRREPADPRGRR